MALKRRGDLLDVKRPQAHRAVPIRRWAGPPRQFQMFPCVLYQTLRFVVIQRIGILMEEYSGVHFVVT